MPSENKFTNETQSLNSQCKIVIYPWVAGIGNSDISDSQLANSSRLEVSSQVLSCTYNKSRTGPAGSFNFTLSNSPGGATNSKGHPTGDWKDIIKRGYWCVIYMSNDGDLRMSNKVGPPAQRASDVKKVRCIGYIQRASVAVTTGEKGETHMVFEVSGSDFGVIYEETSLWHNVFRFEKKLLDSISTSQLSVIGNVRISKVIKTLHNLFYFPLNEPGAQVNNDKSLLSIGLQWLLPKEMVRDLGFQSLPNGTYWGALPGILNIADTEAGIAVSSPTDFLSGNAWQQLLKASIPELHELFTEISDAGVPQLVFRPIPWAIDKSKYPNVGKSISLYKDLASINVPALDLINYNLAEDDHNRYNSFLVTIQTSLIGIEDNISLLQGKGFPKHNKASIRRHGFRPMHISVNTIVRNDELANGSADQRQLVEYNEVIYDYWNNAIFSESGNINKIGTNDVRLGKALTFGSDVPYLNDKRYYIEGYSDNFVVNEKGAAKWVQSVSLTHGLFIDALKGRASFADRNANFPNPGEYTPGGEWGDD